MFRQIDKPFSKKLKKLQNELHIPPFLREKCVVLESGGEIIGVDGIGCAVRFKITEQSQYAAVVTISES